MNFETYTKIALASKFYAPSRSEFTRAMKAIETCLNLKSTTVSLVISADHTILNDVVNVAVKKRNLRNSNASYKRMIYEIVDVY